MNLNNGFKKLLNWIAGIAIFFSAITYFLTGGHFFEKSSIANCVVVDDVKDFTGDFLKHSKSVLYSRVSSAECVAKDSQIDKADGNRKGKVRWAECTYGPDCDEAGMF